MDAKRPLLRTILPLDEQRGHEEKAVALTTAPSHRLIIETSSVFREPLADVAVQRDRQAQSNQAIPNRDAPDRAEWLWSPRRQEPLLPSTLSGPRQASLRHRLAKQR